MRDPETGRDANTDEILETWRLYREKTKDNPPSQLLVEALPYVTQKAEALDLGAGGLIDSKYLLEQGFKHVIAVDKYDTGRQTYDQLPQDKIEYIISSFEEYQFLENAFDLVSAQRSLPFTHPEHFESVFKKIKDALKNQGIFTGNFFGDRDSWKLIRPNMTFQTEDEVKGLFQDMEVLGFKEIEKDAATELGEMKHWHRFNVIARKK